MSTTTSLPSPDFQAEDIGPSLIGTASTFIALSTVFVVLRYYARYLTRTGFGVEDVLIPFAWMAEVGLCVTAIGGYFFYATPVAHTEQSLVMVEKASTGRHTAFVQSTEPSRIVNHFKGIMVNEVLHLPAVAFPKLVVVILYLRVFTNRWARKASWALIFVISATWFSYTVAVMFQCTPFAFNWDKSIPNGKCFNVVAFGGSSSIPNIVTDVAVLLLPIRTVMDLKVSIGRRMGLALIFLTGSVGIIASIIRTVVFVNFRPLEDPLFNNVNLVTWTIIEPGMYLFAACALSFKPLFRMIANALRLDWLVTNTRSFVGRHTSKTTKTTRTGTTTSGIHMDTLKTRHTGFTRLKSPQFPVPTPAAPAKGDDKTIRVTITTTMETKSDARSSKNRDEYDEHHLIGLAS